MSLPQGSGIISPKLGCALLQVYFDIPLKPGFSRHTAYKGIGNTKIINYTFRGNVMEFKNAGKLVTVSPFKSKLEY